MKQQNDALESSDKSQANSDLISKHADFKPRLDVVLVLSSLTRKWLYPFLTNPQASKTKVRYQVQFQEQPQIAQNSPDSHPS